MQVDDDAPVARLRRLEDRVTYLVDVRRDRPRRRGGRPGPRRCSVTRDLGQSLHPAPPTRRTMRTVVPPSVRSTRRSSVSSSAMPSPRPRLPATGSRHVPVVPDLDRDRAVGVAGRAPRTRRRRARRRARWRSRPSRSPRRRSRTPRRAASRWRSSHRRQRAPQPDQHAGLGGEDEVEVVADRHRSEQQHGDVVGRSRRSPAGSR